MKNITILAIAFISISFAACRKRPLVGEGPIVTETRELPSFTTVEADGSMDVIVHPSTTNKAIVTGYHNLVPVFETDVHNGRLRLKYGDKYFNVAHNNIRVDVYTTGMNSFSIDGSAKVTIKRAQPSANMNLSIDGSGDIDVEENHFVNMNCKINGSGKINARECTTDHAWLNISGSGNIKLTILKTLGVKISGSGDVDYWGNPQITHMDVSGSGKIRKGS